MSSWVWSMWTYWKAPGLRRQWHLQPGRQHKRICCSMAGRPKRHVHTKLFAAFESGGAQSYVVDHANFFEYRLSLIGLIREPLDVCFTPAAHVNHVAACNPDGVSRATSAL